MLIAFDTNLYMRNFAPGRNPNRRKADPTQENNRDAVAARTRNCNRVPDPRPGNRSNASRPVPSDHDRALKPAPIEPIHDLNSPPDIQDIHRKYGAARRCKKSAHRTAPQMRSGQRSVQGGQAFSLVA
jgi:hypothetical protein